VLGCGRFGFDAADPPGDGRPGNSGDGGDAPIAGGCPAFALFCEDFESGSLNTNTWTTEIVGSSTTMITTSQTHDGTYALDSQSGVQGSAGVSAIARPIGSHSTGTLAARVWVNAAVPIENFDLVLGFSDALDNNYTTVGGDQFAAWVSSEARTSSGTTDLHSTTPTTANQWTCVELVFAFGTPPQVQVFIDDAQVVAAAGVTPSPTYTHVRVGNVRGDNLGFHVFTDGLAVATQRIGCN
jgi:hypothetical protein